MKIQERIYCLQPMIDEASRILILGTMPGSDSLKANTYYANRNNHFWDFLYRILIPAYPPYQLFDHATPKEDRYRLLRENGIALWDVLSDCIREGNRDSDIKEEKLNDFSMLAGYKIGHIVFSSPKARQYAKPLCKAGVFANQEVHLLNSTSSMNPNNVFATFSDWRSTFQKLLAKPA